MANALKRESNFLSFRSFIVATISELITSGGDKKRVSSFMFRFCCQISAVCSFVKKKPLPPLKIAATHVPKRQHSL